MGFTLCSVLNMNPLLGVALFEEVNVPGDRAADRVDHCLGLASSYCSRPCAESHRRGQAARCQRFATCRGWSKGAQVKDLTLLRGSQVLYQIAWCKERTGSARWTLVLKGSQVLLWSRLCLSRSQVGSTWPSCRFSRCLFERDYGS